MAFGKKLESEKFIYNQSYSVTKSRERTWTFNLIVCCLTVALCSFQFGYNIGSLNSVTDLVKKFTRENIFLLKSENATSVGIETNQTLTNLNGTNSTATGATKVDSTNEFLWTVLNSLFVIGGMTGAFTSKIVLDKLGRKYGIIFHNIFTLAASTLVFVSYYTKSPVYLFVSRFLYGIQGAMSCTLVPTYITEISPSNLRGQVGVIPQLFITIGILVAQIFGFKEILAKETTWHIHLAIPIIPSVIGTIMLMILFPESPKALIIKNKDREAAENSLKFLRNDDDVEQELVEIEDELNQNDSSQSQFGLLDLFSSKELRWPLITAVVLNIAQQLSGINAVFFYSQSIFEKSGITPEYIQYAVLSTGLINVFMTFVCVPLIDRLGRKPLLVYPIALVIIDFVVLILLLEFKEQYNFFSYLSIVCIILFIMCFAVGMGPIPFIYTAEVFPQHARSAAMSIAVLSNWISNLLVALFFPMLQAAIHQYVFCIFTVILAFTLALILKKVPETKNKTVDEILGMFNKNSNQNSWKMTTIA